MELLLKLLDINGPSGNEQEVRSFIKKEIQGYVSEIYTDKCGTLVAHKKGNQPTVVLAAHMDEIGLMVKFIHDKGKIHLATVGGIEPITLLGERVKIPTQKGSINGVITTAEIADDETFENIPAIKDIFIDTGLSKEDMLNLGVKIGSYVSFSSVASSLGNKDIISGKALDDRVGCYILIELIKRLKNSKADIYYMFTVQEEIGLYGAKTSVYSINPDWAIVVDVTSTNDFTDRKTKCIGHGPCISIKDSDFITNRCINDWLEDLAKANNIPVQYEVTDKGSTDALSLSVTKGGIPTSLISIPIRNIHTTSGIAHMDDINNAIKLLEALLNNPPKRCLT